MKWKFVILFSVLISLYGFLPVSLAVNRPDLTKPNTLLIHHQECGCPCPDASIKKGILVIPEEIKSRYPNIHLGEVNLTGSDPFDPYDFELAQQDITVSGEVVGIDTIACDPSGCEVAPVFKVKSWSVDSYYPKFWTHGKSFLVLFLLSCLLTAIGTIFFVSEFIKRKLKSG